MPREEFVEHVKKHHTAESNINEVLVAKTIDFAGEDLKRKEEIAATVADNFTKKEIRKMTEQGKVNVIHGEKVVGFSNADGAHSDRTSERPTKILLDDAADKTAITHEFVHLLRSEDKDRKGVTRTVYNQDEKGYVIEKSKLDSHRFTEECAVVAETEIRTKQPTDRPNSCFNKITSEENKNLTKMDKYRLGRNAMRTETTLIKSNRSIQDSSKPKDNSKTEKEREFEIMADGNNLRGQKAMQMFERNFAKSNLGSNSPKGYRKTNAQIIHEVNERKENAKK